MLKLCDSIVELPFVGEKYAFLLKKLEIKTVEDLLHHYPARYEDYSLISPVNKVQPGEVVTVIGRVESFKHRPTRKRGFSIQEAVLADETGKIKLIWFNQMFLRSSVKEGMKMAAAGKIERDGSALVLKSPEYEVVKGPLIHTGRMVPVYPETKGVSSRWIRARIALALGILDWYQGKFDVRGGIRDWLSTEVVHQEKLINLREALLRIHFPNNEKDLNEARERLGFDELLKMQLTALWRKREWKANRKSLTVIRKKAEVEKFINALPFKLTADQTKAIEEIREDMERPTPMNRLLQGDVGSGKTVVAAAAVFATVKSGYQAAFMAPTQVLADQHGETLRVLLEPLGVKIALLTGATARSDCHDASSAPRNDRPFPDLIIGTHALIYKRAQKLINKEKLALVVIDEQHRFGVAQRGKLISEGINPHVLSMTATPIPRTIALTAYADLDLSVIREMPHGRKEVKTWLVPENKREDAYQWIQKEILANKSQAFVVCPLIDLSEHESMKQIKAAMAEFDSLKSHFSQLKLGLMHGRMAGAKKTEVLNLMRDKQIDILVTTPVVEVGVDIPNATIMLVEAAERFGLAQLHQLRGRVGRAEKQSYCLLFSTDGKATSRLRAVTTIHNGMELAQIDLKLRGPGDIFDLKQHGWPEFRIADLGNMTEVRRAYLAAVRILDQGMWKPQLAKFIAPD